MQQRIPVSDPQLAARIDRIVADLEKYYPDHLVSRVATEHKSLDGRITKAYRDAGYDSRASFYEAYGFKTDVAKMGRPASFDVDRLVAEFETRYEGKPKPASLGDLKAQNPDLVGKLKTLENQAKLLTGKTAAAYLQERGLIDKTAAQAMDAKKAAADFDKTVRKLETSAVDDLPQTVADLKAEFPQQAQAIEFAVQHGLTDVDFAAIGLLGGDGRKAPVRSASLGVGECGAAGIPAVILPESAEAKNLPPYVAGIDVPANCELDERTVFVKGDGMGGISAGDVRSADVSPLLAPYEGVEVISRSKVDGVPCAFVRVRAMRSLRHDTLIWLLRDAGIVNDADLRGGRAGVGGLCATAARTPSRPPINCKAHGNNCKTYGNERRHNGNAFGR